MTTQQFNRRIAAVKTADAINAIEGAPVSDYARTIKSICSIIGAVPGSTFILWKIPLTTFTAIWHQIPLMFDILIYTCMTMCLFSVIR